MKKNLLNCITLDAEETKKLLDVFTEQLNTSDDLIHCDKTAIVVEQIQAYYDDLVITDTILEIGEDAANIIEAALVEFNVYLDKILSTFLKGDGDIKFILMGYCLRLGRQHTRPLLLILEGLDHE